MEVTALCMPMMKQSSITVLGRVKRSSCCSRTDLMGVDLPLASIAQAAKLLRVNRVAISLSIQHTGEPMRRMILDLKDRLPEDCLVLIGGKGAARTRRIRGVGRMPELDMI